MKNWRATKDIKMSFEDASITLLIEICNKIVMKTRLYLLGGSMNDRMQCLRMMVAKLLRFWDFVKVGLIQWSLGGRI